MSFLFDKVLESRSYRLTGITPLLGSQPANPAVRTAWIASKAPDPVRDMENAELGSDDLDELNNGTNIFLRDMDHGDKLFIYEYPIRGFFKGALTALQEVAGVANARSKVDKFLFTWPRYIYILKDGKPVIDEDGICERPLRASGPRGERIALASSEMILDPWTIEFTVMLVPNKGTQKSERVTWESVENSLDYGRLQGLGQWRGGGMGRFTWERIDKPSPDAGRDGGGYANYRLREEYAK